MATSYLQNWYIMDLRNLYELLFPLETLQQQHDCTFQLCLPHKHNGRIESWLTYSNFMKRVMKWFINYWFRLSTFNCQLLRPIGISKGSGSFLSSIFSLIISNFQDVFKILHIYQISKGCVKFDIYSFRKVYVLELITRCN